MLYGSWYQEPSDGIVGTNTAFTSISQTSGLDIIFCVTPRTVFLSNSGSAADLNTICLWHAEPFYNFPSSTSPRLETRTGLRDFNLRSNPLETPIDPSLDKPLYIANATEQWTGTVYDIGRDGNNNTLTDITVRYDLVPLEIPFRLSTFSTSVETEVFFDHDRSNLQLRFFLVFEPFGCTEDAHCITFAECDMNTTRCVCPEGATAVDGTGGYGSALECVDTAPPIVTLLGDERVRLEAATEYSDPGASAGDNLDMGVTVVRDPVSIDTAQPDGAVVLLTYTATDAAGNAASVTRTVTVIDTRPPDVALAGSSALTVESASTFVDPGASAFDWLDGAVPVERDPLVIDTAQPNGTVITLTYSATDAAGNRNQVTRTLTFEDTTPPDITLTGTFLVQIEATEPYVDDGAAAVDSLDGPLPVTVNPTDIDTAVADRTEYTIKYTSTDAAGNVGTAERKVIVRDTLPPVFEGVDDEEDIVPFNGTESYTLNANVAANDKLDGRVQVVIISGAVDRTQPGRYSLTMMASDAAGNAATADYTVAVSPPIDVPAESKWYIKVTKGTLLPGPVDHFALRESLTSYVVTGATPVVLEVYRSAGVVEVAVLNASTLSVPWTNATESLTQFRSALDSQGDADLQHGLARLWGGKLMYTLVEEVDSSVSETPGGEAGAAAPVGAIAGGVVAVALLFLLFAMYKYRQRQKAATRAVIFQADNPTFAAGGRRVAAKQWIMSLEEPTATGSALQNGVLPGAYVEAGGAPPSYGVPMLLLGADATGEPESGCSYMKMTRPGGAYDTPGHDYEQLNSGEGYARPIRTAAQGREHRLSTVSVQPGYTPLREDRKRDPDACVSGERLRSGEQTGAVSATTTGYAMLDGTQQLYVHDAGGAVGEGSMGDTLPGLYATMPAESSTYLALPRRRERRPTLFSQSTQRVSGIVADEEA
jgi:hypothetical protein